MPCRKIEFVTSGVLDLHIQVSSHLRSSHLTSSHPHDICASSHLRSLHLRFSYRRIVNPHQQIIPSQIFISYIFTSAAHLRIFIAQLLQSSLSLHIFGSSSASYLIIFKISVCHCYNLVDLRLQNFMSINIFPSLSGQPSSSCFQQLQVFGLICCMAIWYPTIDAMALIICWENPLQALFTKGSTQELFRIVFCHGYGLKPCRQIPFALWCTEGVACVSGQKTQLHF